MQGQFTKEEAQATIDAVNEVFKAVPKTRQGNYLGHLNDIFLFLEAAKRNAPAEALLAAREIAAKSKSK
jgi:hypothetical protein